MQTFKDFLTVAPLYSWRSVKLPELAKDLDPGQMELHCSTCGGPRPFRDRQSSGSGAGMYEPPKPLQNRLYYFEVYCGFCGLDKYVFMVEADPDRGRVRKVGQHPPWSIELDRDTEETLGKSKELFKKGLVCLSQGFGLGACTYFRRALEEQIDSILGLLEQLLSMDPATKAEAESVADLRRSKAADKKLEKAYPLVPTSLMVDGINPLKLLYGFLSQGVHALSEDDCCVLAEKIYETHVYVVSELRRAVTSRDRFIQQVKSLRAIRLGAEAEETAPNPAAQPDGYAAG